MTATSYPEFSVALLTCAALSGACGGSSSDLTNIDAAPQCTVLPEVVDTGMTAPREASIDPSTYEIATQVVFDPESILVDDMAFPLGVQSGAMKASSVLLWAKYDAQATYRLRVWRDSETVGDVILVYDADAASDAGGYTRVTVTGLAPATTYAYAFFTGSAPGFTGRSRIGTVRTAGEAGMELRVKVGATTCTGSNRSGVRDEVEPYPALTEISLQNIDFTVHLGDISYNDSASDVAGYRALWEHTLGQTGYRDLRARAGWYVTWDDHEIDDNYDPETIDSSKLAAAKQAFWEYIAVEGQQTQQLWHSYQWGDTVEVIVLDVRSERRPSTLGSQSPEFISPAQLAFLKDRLSNSPAHFKLVMSSINITNMSELWDPGGSYEDRWEGWELQRTEVLDHIVDNDIENVWFLAGDLHVGFVGRVEPEGHPYSKIWEITVGPGASGDNPLGTLVDAELPAAEDIFPCNQFVFGHGRRQVETTLELDPLANTIHVRFVDTLTDEVLFDEIMQQEPVE